ncbi:hypothetical protein HK107_01750 [Parvularcula sp. ZS-1/3]|uniref:Uncharacterized protein n=1 Tax=Parvularcula mediterranea TaxID=2732508 RepID=A0A7Y3RJ76_9PROT|nr:hypothetical protein [Parvularcula mediterranea]NNU15047.1 hypothetical protein [Parvularcula mediterranea]
MKDENRHQKTRLLIGLLGLVMGFFALEVARDVPFYIGAPFGFAALMTMIAAAALTDKQLDQVREWIGGKR